MTQEKLPQPLNPAAPSDTLGMRMSRRIWRVRMMWSDGLHRFSILQQLSLDQLPSTSAPKSCIKPLDNLHSLSHLLWEIILRFLTHAMTLFSPAVTSSGFWRHAALWCNACHARVEFSKPPKVDFDDVNCCTTKGEVQIRRKEMRQKDKWKYKFVLKSFPPPTEEDNPRTLKNIYKQSLLLGAPIQT